MKSGKPIPSLAKTSPCKSPLQLISQVPKETLCSFCAASLANYIPEYFLGEPFNPACENCRDKDSSWKANENIEEFYSVDSDPTCIYLTFMPPSMVSHWLPVETKSFQRPSSILSMVSHCTLLPTQGTDSFHWMRL